jgi:hypothetical protein
MGRRRRPIPVTMTTISITLETLELISKFKNKRENQDDFIKRVFNEWQEYKEIVKDTEARYNYKSKLLDRANSEIEKLRNIAKQHNLITIQLQDLK